MHDWAIPVLILATAAAVAMLAGRRTASSAILSAILGLGWFAIVLLGGGTFLSAAIGLAALLPFAAGRVFAGNAMALRMAMFAIAFTLFVLAHVDRLASLADIALLALTGLGMLLFLLRSPETDRAPGIEAAHLGAAALGVAAVAIDLQRLGPALSLPAMLAGAMAGCLLASRPVGSAPLGFPGADAAALLVAFLLGDLVLTGAWSAAIVLGSMATLEIVVLLVTAARADRSNDKDRPRGVFAEAMARKRSPRSALIGTIVAGILMIVLALGASQGEWIAALLGAGALMWLFQRFLWRLVPERRPG